MTYYSSTDPLYIIFVRYYLKLSHSRHELSTFMIYRNDYYVSSQNISCSQLQGPISFRWQPESQMNIFHEHHTVGL
jgi:hypothetical protein